MEIKIAGKKDLPSIVSTLKILRPHLNDVKINELFEIQSQEGFQMIYLGDDQKAYALAGFRTLHTFYSGKTLYIDDLVTHPDHLRKGYAGQLLDWIKAYANDNGYDHLSLDSGFSRKDAYRLYLNKGLEVECLHFGRKVAEL